MPDSPNYQTECPTIEAFVQRVVILAGHGYYHFCLGELDPDDDCSRLDSKMVGKYALSERGVRSLSKAERSRRRGRGKANVDFFRFRFHYIVMTTDGAVSMTIDDPDQFEDLRDASAVFGEYEISISEVGFTKGGAPKAKVWTKLSDEARREVRRDFLNSALVSPRGALENRFYTLPYNCYRGIRVQLRSILDEMNSRRGRKGLKKLNPRCIRFKRELPKHFVAEARDGQQAA